MSNGILEPDHTKRNVVVFLVACIIFGITASFYFIQNHGCREYTDHLKACTKYVCTQRVMGFESKYLGHTALTLRREIVGLEKDKFMDEQFCNVVETDNVSTDEIYKCKYSDKTRAEVADRAAILFSIAPLPATSDFADAKAANILRASYATRTPDQVKECVK